MRNLTAVRLVSMTVFKMVAWWAGLLNDCLRAFGTLLSTQTVVGDAFPIRVCC